MPAPKQPQSILLRALPALQALFPADWLQAKARETKVVIRKRQFDPAIMFWSLVLSFSKGLMRQLATFKRTYQTISGVTISNAAFYVRFNKKLVVFLKAALERAFQEIHPVRRIKGALERFRDILLIDGTIVTLHDSLAKVFEGTRTEAAIKISCVMSVVCETLRSVRIFAENTPDGKTFRLGPWVKDHLLIFDLGYFKHKFFARILEYGGHFLSRLKKNSNPLITAVYRKWRGKAVDLEGKRLKDVLPSLKREEIDVEVELKFDRREYAGQTKKDSIRVRLVGVLNEETGEYHLYVTDLPAELLTPCEIAALYSGRWAMELLFKELKSFYKLDVIHSTRRETVEILVYTALLTLVISKRLYAAFLSLDKTAQGRVTPLRWAQMFFEVADTILPVILKQAGFEFTLDDFLRLREQSCFSPITDGPHLGDLWNAFNHDE
jgi:IS4 transposase